MLQLSNIRGVALSIFCMVILLPPLLYSDGFLAFGGVCDWRSDATIVVELLDYHLAMFGVSLRISWSCCWLVLWGCYNEWTEEVEVCVDAWMMVMDEAIGYIMSNMNFGDITNPPFKGSYRKHNLYLNWSNEVKKKGIHGGTHGKEWRR